MGSREPSSDAGSFELRRELDDRDHRAELAEDVREGLGSSPRTLPPKYFYDARGSRLFEEITRLPEYYLTEAERSILEARAEGLVEDAGAEALVEYGAGSAGKTRLLLDALHRAGRLRGYAPIDVSAEPVRAVAGELAARYPEARVVGVIADFEQPVDLPFDGWPRMILFLGSTIGNFPRGRAVGFLRRVAGQIGPEDTFLVGFDLVKDPEILEAAYDDPQGVTAAFNLNVLRVLNRELGADFDLDGFRHHAFWNADERRIEMHLRSTRRQTVRIAELGMEVELDEGESIRTELSHKYTRGSAGEILETAGLTLDRWDTDAEGRFALGLARTD
ncbi:MAG: L-histidine N(alpha)-methyltransferase [Gemmatimonadota bacterium]